MQYVRFKDFFIFQEKKEDYYKPVKVNVSFSSLEPFTSEETMNVHYNKHYKVYIKKCNE